MARVSELCPQIENAVLLSSRQPRCGQRLPGKTLEGKIRPALLSLRLPQCAFPDGRFGRSACPERRRYLGRASRIHEEGARRKCECPLDLRHHSPPALVGAERG